MTSSRRNRTQPAVIGSPEDTINDRHSNTPALRFEDYGGGEIWLVRANGTRYAFAGRSDLPGWLDYYRRMADALDVFLHPLEPEAVDSEGSDDEPEEEPNDERPDEPEEEPEDEPAAGGDIEGDVCA